MRLVEKTPNCSLYIKARLGAKQGFGRFVCWKAHVDKFSNGRSLGIYGFRSVILHGRLKRRGLFSD
jgi:hypothetical protein